MCLRPDGCSSFWMNITYHCPACHKSIRDEVSARIEFSRLPGMSRANCDSRERDYRQPAKPLPCVPEHRSVFARKDFPQRLGVALVILGFVGSSIAWANYQVFWTFAILFAHRARRSAAVRVHG